MYFEMPAIGEPHGAFAKDDYQENLQQASRDFRGLLMPGALNLTVVEFIGNEFTIIEGGASEVSLASQSSLELTIEQIRESVIEINSSTGERASRDVQQLMMLLGDLAIARGNFGIHEAAALPFMLYALQPEWAVWQQAYFEPSPNTSFEVYTTTFCDNDKYYNTARAVQATIKDEAQTTSASLLEINEMVIGGKTTLQPKYDALELSSEVGRDPAEPSLAIMAAIQKAAAKLC